MTTKTQTILTVIASISIFAGAVTYAVYPVFREAENAAWRSCTLSITDAILTSDNSETRKSLNAGPDWRLLTKDETATLLNSIDNKKGFDCYQLFTRPHGGSQLPENLEIHARRNANGDLDVSIK